MAINTLLLGVLSLALSVTATVTEDLDAIADKLNTIDFHISEYNNETQKLDLSGFHDLFAAYDAVKIQPFTKIEEEDIVNYVTVLAYDYQLFSELISNKADLIKKGGFGNALSSDLHVLKFKSLDLLYAYEAETKDDNPNASNELDSLSGQIDSYIETAISSV
ncbi:hypothetical protein M409DRAFT_23239 [Zasmidium cellare ATCC 36951]|uniref:Uncharacterized protein n=1 Tax=Zasmidium cellare ATCC 36951 TaxID=1080233 RepID=A0A6A6CHJ6_ZASCE|nr:uncharacterized protein M409DRAFT_23239 [Zasmidium cellare ATCC 36951]KAF2166605.1 hypothetical protein M409DRAFT_23239 [Zasmidium cellare ATCC 36951]